MHSILLERLIGSKGHSGTLRRCRHLEKLRTTNLEEWNNPDSLFTRWAHPKDAFLDSRSELTVKKYDICTAHFNELPTVQGRVKIMELY